MEDSRTIAEPCIFKLKHTFLNNMMSSKLRKILINFKHARNSANFWCDQYTFNNISEHQIEQSSLYVIKYTLQISTIFKQCLI